MGDSGVIHMAEINVEKLREKLYKAAIALSCIGEVCVDVSKQHISAERAIDKIRHYLYDADVIGSRYRVDKLLQECMDSTLADISLNKEINDWFNKALSEKLADIDRFVYFADEDQIKEHKADYKRIAEAVERTKKYIKE
jgi:hypothetical protein